MIPQRIGRYEIKDLLGRGGMASVYQAYDPHFERDVAVKILPREFLHDPTFRSRFQREARTIGALEHVAIVPVHDFGEEDGQPYLVMRLMGGGSLADRIQNGPLSVRDTTRIVERIGDALDAAHGVGIIHRDLKPSNILFDRRGNPYIADFGIVKVAEESAMLTGSGMVGTPPYMAPEMAQKGGLTPLVDVYALGVTIFQMLTGRLPFEADTPAGMIMAHIAMPVPDPRQLRPDLSGEVARIIEGALAKDPTQRYQSAGQLAADLVTAAAGMPLEKALDSTVPDVPLKDTRARTLHIPEASVPANTLGLGTPPARSEPAERAFPALRPVHFLGIGGGVLAIAAAVLAATGVISLGPRSAPTAEATPQATQETVEQVVATEAATATPASLQPSIEILYGSSQAMPSGQAEFVAMEGNQPLNAGDTIRTSDSSAALLTFGQGVSAELHPDSEVSLVQLVEADGVLTIELSQTSGATYHFIHRADSSLPVEYSVSTPVATATATGTEFWVVETDEGWCFLPTESSIEVDVGEPDSDLNDNYLARSSDGTGWLITADGTASPCQPDDERLPLTDGSVLVVSGEPTATLSLSGQGGSSGVCGNGRCDTATENSDICPADCSCRDNGTCEAGEGAGCRDCGSSAGSCGAPCSSSATCGGGLSCAGGVCWDACQCQGQCGGTGGTGGQPIPTSGPECGTCGVGGCGWYLCASGNCSSGWADCYLCYNGCSNLCSITEGACSP